MINLVRRAFHQAIDEAQVTFDLKQAAKRHPRVEEIVKSLTLAFQDIQDERQKLRKPPVKESTITWATESYAGMFIRKVEIEAHKRGESDLNRVLREQKEKHAKDLEKTAEGTPSGDFESMVKEGLVINETGDETYGNKM